MPNPPVDRSKLSADQRVELVNQLWDAVARDGPERPELSSINEIEADRRETRIWNWPFPRTRHVREH